MWQGLGKTNKRLRVFWSEEVQKWGWVCAFNRPPAFVAAPKVLRCTWGGGWQVCRFCESVTNPMKPNSFEFTGKSGIGSKWNRTVSWKAGGKENCCARACVSANFWAGSLDSGPTQVVFKLPDKRLQLKKEVFDEGASGHALACLVTCCRKSFVVDCIVGEAPLQRAVNAWHVSLSSLEPWQARIVSTYQLGFSLVPVRDIWRCLGEQRVSANL